LLLASIAAAGAAAAAAWRFWPEQGLTHPCRPALATRLARHEFVLEAWASSTTWPQTTRSYYWAV